MPELQNEVQLIGTYGNDETHALSAWTSTSRDLDDTKRARIGPLLHQLATNGHMTPFEKSSLHYLVKTDIASHIHLLKHRIGISLNAESARYRELGERSVKGEMTGTDQFYVPSDWPRNEQDKLIEWAAFGFRKYHATLERLVAGGMSRARAKESARFYLPYAAQITADVMFNWRSFAHFQKLRNSRHAQLEIRQIAQEMLRLVEETNQWPLTIQALRSAGYLATIL